MRVSNELPVVFVGPEAAVDVVVVGAGIAVVALTVDIVFEQRSVPDGGHAEVLEVAQLAADALDVAAVPAVELVRGGLFGRLGGRIVGRVAVDEAVGHDKIDKVGGREARACCRTAPARADLIGDAELFLPVGEADAVSARLGGLVDLDIDEEVVGALGFVGDSRLHALAALDPHVEIADVAAVNHQLERGVHPYPPAERLDMPDAVGAGLDLPLPRLGEPDSYGHGVLAFRAPVDQGRRVAGDDLERGVGVECGVGMLELCKLLIEVGPLALAPLRSLVFLEELETTEIAHFLTGVNQRLTVW